MRLKSTLIATAAIAGFAMLGFAAPAYATNGNEAKALCAQNPKCSATDIGNGGGIYCVGKSCVICMNATTDKCVTGLNINPNPTRTNIVGILMQQSGGGAQPDTLNQPHGTTVHQAPASGGGVTLF